MIARAFSGVPPTKEQDLIDLLVGRDEELKAALSIFHQSMDQDQILAIGGLARSGKSHFLLRLLHEVREKFSLIVPVPNRQGKSLRVILRAAIHAMEDELFRFLERVPNIPIAKSWLDLSIAYEPAINGNDLLIDRNQADKLIAPLLGGPRDHRRANDLRKELLGTTQADGRILVRPLQSQVLAKLFSLAHTALRSSEPSLRTLLCIDDFDILLRDQDGRYTPQKLLSILFELAQLEGMTVLTTVRTGTLDVFAKAFCVLVKLSGLSEEAQVQAYQARMDRYAVPGTRLPSLDLIRQAASASDGRVGALFDFLRRGIGIEKPAQCIEEMVQRILQACCNERQRHLFVKPDSQPALSLGMSKLHGSALMELCLVDSPIDGTATLNPIVIRYQPELAPQEPYSIGIPAVPEEPPPIDSSEEESQRYRNAKKLWAAGLRALVEDLPGEAVVHFQETLRHYIALGLADGRGISHAALGESYLRLEQIAEARSHFTQAMEIGKKRGAKLFIAHTHVRLGDAAFLGGGQAHYRKEAKTWYDEALRHFEEHRDLTQCTQVRERIERTFGALGFELRTWLLSSSLFQPWLLEDPEALR